MDKENKEYQDLPIETESSMGKDSNGTLQSTGKFNHPHAMRE